MKIKLHAGQVLDDGRVAVSFIWPREWGPVGIPREIEMEPPEPFEAEALTSVSEKESTK